MPEVYTVPSGQQDPNLPPINLPHMDTGQQPAGPLRITVGSTTPPPPPTAAPTSALEDWPDTPSGAAQGAKAPAETKSPPALEDWPDQPPERPEERPVGTGEALGTGFRHGFTFGAAPALAGLSEAAGQTTSFINPNVPVEEDPLRPFIGGAKMLHNYFSDHPDPAVKEAYERGRKRAVAEEELAKEQHPRAFLAGNLAGAVAVPLPGSALRASTLGGRALIGAGQGALAGGAYGAGEAIGRGEAPAQIAGGALRGGAVGGVLGGGIGAAIGPRAVGPGLTSGQRAARTAETLLEAPLPRAVASDSPALQAAGARSQAVPLLGTRLGSMVSKTAEAAREHVGGIARGMAGGMTPERDAAAALLRPGFEHVIQGNKATIDAGYNALRGQIDQTARFTMPRTDAALNDIMRARAEAGWPEPVQGLGQFRNIAGGATFNGAHRARVDARDAGNVAVPHPGYNAADFNRLTGAMTADLREMAQAAATDQTPQGRAAALAAFDKAEKQFGPLADQNAFLRRLTDMQGQGALTKVLNAAKEKGGNLPLLAQLRQGMSPQDFEQVGGIVLSELGYKPSIEGKFSLAQFATEWGKLSPGAKRVLFSPQHTKDIEDIAQMAEHIKGALRETNTSKTAHTLMMFDLARDAILLSMSAAAGTVTASTGVGLAAGAAGMMFTRWMSSPAKAASIGAFTRAYRGVTMGQPTPARVAVFKIATRNLANTLGLPLDRVTGIVQNRLGGATEPSQPQQ